MNQELKLQIEVKDIEAVKTFIDTVEKYFYDLPKELQDTLIAFSEKGISGISADQFHKKYGNSGKFETSIENNKITRLNEVLKSVTYIEETKDSYREITIYPNEFWIKFDGKTVISW